MNDRFKFRLIIEKSYKTVNGTLKGQIIHYCNGFIQTKTKTYFFGNNKRISVLNSQVKAINQCTGLKDKNGKFIYEGDIVKGEYLGVIKFGEYQGNFTHYIKWQRKYADLLRGDINYWIEYAEKSIKVIGNVYQNEELLNGTNP